MSPHQYRMQTSCDFLLRRIRIFAGKPIRKGGNFISKHKRADFISPSPFACISGSAFGFGICDFDDSLDTLPAFHFMFCFVAHDLPFCLNRPQPIAKPGTGQLIPSAYAVRRISGHPPIVSMRETTGFELRICRPRSGRCTRGD